VAVLAAYIALMFALIPDYRREVTLDLVFMFVLCGLTVLIAVGVGWFGVQLTVTAARFNPNPESRLHVKILVIALLCSFLLAFRAVWWMALAAARELRAEQFSLWFSLVTPLLSEVVPICLMAYLMLPIPRPPESFPLRRSSQFPFSPSNVQRSVN
jgi:F0F1-type ATP synthase membrane subunit c/vacuolar-type H+-ATPase subunit K